MNKSTLKKGGIVLLGALAVTGVSFAVSTMATSGDLRAPWYPNEAAFNSPSIAATQLKPLDKVDIHDHALVTGTEYGNYYSVMDFAKMEDTSLMDGLFVTFQNLEEPKLPFEGKHETISYDKIQNHEWVNTSTTFTAVDETGKTCLGVYQTMAAKGRVDFVYSTKGLMGVEGVDVDIASYGNKALVNRMIDWSYDVYIYDLAGNYISQPVADKVIFTSSNHEIGKAHAWRNLLRTSDSGTLKQGDLDNKIIVIMFKSEFSQPDPELEETAETAKVTEPLTLFRNARIAFNRPGVAFGAANTKVFEAGAGRNTSCDPDTLVTNVEFWNTMYVDNKPNNTYTATFEGVDRDGLFNADQAPQEELAYYELNVEYPFIAAEMEIANEDRTEAQDWVSLERMFKDEKIGRIGKPGVTDTVTYLIPREYFVQTDLKDDRDCKSTARFTYYFAPQEVKKFEKASYIWSTITAEASDTARYELQGSSIPEYKELNDLFFDEYLDYQTAEVSFKNLPYFNSVEGRKDNYTLPTQLYGAFTLENQTKAPKHSTGRYDDDVNIKGWKIVYLKDESELEGEDDSKTDSTYYYGRFLPMTVKGTIYVDFKEWLEKNGCPDCCIEDWPEIGGTCKTIEVIGCDGNIKDNIVSINPIFKYHRGDVNIGDDESKYVNETYTIAPRLVYDASIARYNNTGNVLKRDPKYTYSAQDLINKVGGAVYEGPIKIYGNNTFVWFKESDQSLLSHAMGAVNSEFLKYFTSIDRKDFFFAPYDEWGTSKFESRPHTVKVFATGLKPDVDGGTIASIKVFKEQFSKSENVDDAYYHTNGFVFTGESNYDFAKVFVKRGSREYPIEDYTHSSFGKYTGMSIGDTLIYKIDLDDDYAVKYVEETGLDMFVKYVPYNDVNLLPILGEHWNECFQKIPNVFNHVAQFGVTTANNKGWNEFYTFGTTDRGLVTTMNADKIIGSYTSFYSFLTQQFGSCNTCGGLENDGPSASSSDKNWVPTPNLIYNEMFRKDYDTRYVNTCYQLRKGQFIIAGINIVDSVDMEVFTNKVGAFNYEVTVLGDLNGEAYGKVDTVGNVVKISPNKYGEVLALVQTNFDPTDRDGIEMSIDTITSGTERGMWARYYAKDSIRLAPQQYGADVEAYNRVYFFDLDDYKHNLTFDDERWGHFGIWAPYGVNVNDTLTAVIKGDVKVPEVWFSSDAEGKNVINAFDFGLVNAGTVGDSVIYIQGRDLPHYGTTVNETDPKIQQEINLLSGTDLFTFGNNAKEVKLMIREKSMELAAVAEDQPYVFKGGEGDLKNGVMRGDVAAKIELHATPNVEDLCDNTNLISLTAVCDVQKDLSLAFTPGLEKPYILDMEPGDIGGSDARIKWTATPGAQYYQVAVGRFTPKFTSKDVFISEVRADQESKNIWVELFNATGDVIHPENQVNYWLQIIKEYKDENGVAQKDTISERINNTSLQGNTEPIYNAVWKYEPIVHPLKNMEMTTDHTNPIKYTIRLMEGFNTDAHQIDIYLFDTPSTWMVRKPVNGMPINGGEFNTGEWRTEVGSLPNPYYEWQDDINFDGEESYKVAPTSTSIAVHHLLPQTAYTVRVRAFNECVGGEEMIPSEDFYDFATSKTPTGSGDIYFDEADEHGPSVGNESINTTAVRVVGGEGKVTILNAAGKTVTVSNVLGQTVANKVISSDNETINAPAGIVVVAIESETAVKTVVK